MNQLSVGSSVVLMLFRPLGVALRVFSRSHFFSAVCGVMCVCVPMCLHMHVCVRARVCVCVCVYVLIQPPCVVVCISVCVDIKNPKL